MANLDQAVANKILDHLNGVKPYAPTPPLMLALVTQLGSATTFGTEVTGGGYTRQPITFAPAPPRAPGGSASSSGTLTFTNMPACTIVGLEIWDSASSPQRLWCGPLIAPRPVNATEDLPFGPGDVADGLG